VKGEKMKYSLLSLIFMISLVPFAVEAKGHIAHHSTAKKVSHTNVKKAVKKTAIKNKKEPIKKPAKNVGLASFYGRKFHGRPTASGEIFNQYAMTAAHRSYPLQSKVKVTNLKNKKSVVVRINDRGPWVKNRIMDLSKSAAVALNISGVEKVSLNLLN
jgi:rare lipoprotein A (peptidoglycan hydrolase)